MAIRKQRRPLEEDEARNWTSMLHVLFIDALSMSATLSLDHVVFHGGTNLHLSWGSPRLSENLDFLVSRDFAPKRGVGHFHREGRTGRERAAGGPCGPGSRRVRTQWNGEHIVNDPDEIALWPADLRRCPICDGQGVETALAIGHGGAFDGVEATCHRCTFTVESSEPEALRFTIEMFVEGGKALAEAMAVHTGPDRPPESGGAAA